MPSVKRRSSDTGLINTDLKRRRLTRYQEQLARSVFRFFELPAELRNIIYNYGLDASAAQNIIDRYYGDVRNARKISKVAAPFVWARCPGVFLLNQQSYYESSPLVRKQSLTFDHGLLDLLDITDFMPRSLIRTVGSITIDDSGHDLFKDNIMAASWLGYTTLIEQLAGILSNGHNLKSFTLSLGHSELVPHVTTCWHADFKCGFRDTLRKACDALRSVRNIGKVTLRGLPEPLAIELKQRMESTPVGFFDLPAELRNIVYSHALDWSDVSTSLAQTMSAWVDKTDKPPYPPRSTPTVLLLNRQITGEALEVLHKKPLTLVCPSDHDLQKQQQVPNILKLISMATLKHVRHLSLTLESWEWIYSLDHVLPVFKSPTTGNNAVVTVPGSPIGAGFTSINTPTCDIQHAQLPGIASNVNTLILPALKTFHLTFRDSLKARFLADARQSYPDHTLHTSLSNLANIRGLQSVTFEGDIPQCYTGPLRQIMTMPHHGQVVGGQQLVLPSLMAIKGSGEVVEVDERDD